jgi:GT2 family glycosyltransferase
LIYLSETKPGPAAARNLGIKHARSRLILFIGDDCIADRSLVDKHVTFHKTYSEENIAILGYTTWHRKLHVTAFMHWLEHGGLQFDYDMLKDGDIADTFYTSNVSFKLDFILNNNGFFDEDFPYAAYEDTELAYRLQSKGLRVLFQRDAVAYHFHPTTLRDYCYRIRNTGKSALILRRKIPQIISKGSQGNRQKTLVQSMTRQKHARALVSWLVKVASKLDQIGLINVVSKLDQNGVRLPKICYRGILMICYIEGMEMVVHPNNRANQCAPMGRHKRQ